MADPTKQSCPHLQAPSRRCDDEVDWPELEEIVVRGVAGAVDTGAIILRLLPGGGNEHNSGTTLTAEQVRFHTHRAVAV